MSAGSATVTATIAGVSGSVPLGVSNSGISLDIVGPDASQPYDFCNYSLSVQTTGLTFPLSYAWRGPDNSSGTDATFAAGGTSTNYVVDVTVTDASGRSGTATKYVNVSHNNSSCAQ